MSETESEAQAETDPKPVAVDGNGEVIEEPSEDESLEESLQEEEPDEDDAELQATIEREHELAAERQEEAASIEAQKREQDQKRKKLDQLAAHVAKRYGEILGDDLDGFVGCPLCGPWYPGIRLQVMPDYETVAAVKAAIGEDPDPPLTNDHYSKVCDDCAGLGKVLTGSKVTGQTTAQCLPCKGLGWVSIGPEREQGMLTSAQPVPSPPSNGAPLPTGDDPPEAAALRALGFIVVPPVSTPEAIAAQSGQ